MLPLCWLAFGLSYIHHYRHKSNIPTQCQFTGAVIELCIQILHTAGALDHQHAELFDQQFYTSDSRIQSSSNRLTKLQRENITRLRSFTRDGEMPHSVILRRDVVGFNHSGSHHQINACGILSECEQSKKIKLCVRVAE